MESFDKIEEEEYMKEKICNLTLLSGMSLCTRGAGGGEEGEGGRWRWNSHSHNTSMLLPFFTDNLTGDNDDDSDAGDQGHLLHCPHHDCQP